MNQANTIINLPRTNANAVLATTKVIRDNQTAQQRLETGIHLRPDGFHGLYPGPHRQSLP